MKKFACLAVLLFLPTAVRADPNPTLENAWDSGRAVSGNGTYPTPVPQGYTVTVWLIVDVNGTKNSSGDCDRGGGAFQGTVTGIPKGTWPTYAELRLYNAQGVLVGGPYKSNTKNVTVQ